MDRVLAHGPTISGLRDAQGMEIHRGLPSFFSQSADGIGRNLTSKNLCWRLAGRRNWKLGLPDASSCIGRYQIGWRDENNATRAFVSIRLLPATAKIHMSAAADGSLHFSASGLPLGTAVTLAESSTDLSRGDGTIQLALGAAAAIAAAAPPSELLKPMHLLTASREQDSKHIALWVECHRQLVARGEP